MTEMEQPTYITPLMEQQMFDDWCPYNGNPDPRSVWAAATDAINGLFLSMQQVAPTWKAEQLDEHEIRVTSPEGESWRLRSADRNDSFNNFIWRWAESMINTGGNSEDI